VKSWAPVIVALLGFGTAVVQMQHATEAESYGVAKDAQTEALLSLVADMAARECE